MEKDLSETINAKKLLAKSLQVKRIVLIEEIKQLPIDELEELQYELHKEYTKLAKSIGYEGIDSRQRLLLLEVDREVSRRMKTMFHLDPDFSLDYDQYRKQLDRFLCVESLKDKLKRMSKNLDKLTNRWEKDHIGLEPRLQILCIREYISKKLNLSYLYDVDDECEEKESKDILDTNFNDD